MPLTYREQQALVKEGTEYLLEGQTYASWKEELVSRGYYPFDTDRLGFAIAKNIADQVSERMLPELEEGTVVNHYGLATDAFERVVQQQKAQFRKLRDARVRLLARQDYTQEEILAELEHPLYDLDDISHVLTKESKRREFNETKTGLAGASGSKAGLIGGLSLAAGVTLTSMMSGQGYVTFFWGLIAFGLYMIGKSFWGKY